MSSVVVGTDGVLRCDWCSDAPEFYVYHDGEWGYPEGDDILLFEKLCLESFQSGLSWRTILAKRDNFRSAFHGFDFNVVSEFTDDDIKLLLTNEGIVRHRGKIEAVINNARCAKKIVEQKGSIAAFFWSFEPNEEGISDSQQALAIDASKAFAKALKKNGWKFIGPTTSYAFMQAAGIINDHVEDCVFRNEAIKARENFNKPKFR